MLVRYSIVSMDIKELNDKALLEYIWLNVNKPTLVAHAISEKKDQKWKDFPNMVLCLTTKEDKLLSCAYQNR